MPRKLDFSRNIPSYIPNSLKASDFWDHKNQHHEFILGTLRNAIFKKWNVFQLLTWTTQGFGDSWILRYSTSPPRQVALKPNSASSRHWDSFLLSSLCKRCLWGMGVDFLIEQFSWTVMDPENRCAQRNRSLHTWNLSCFMLRGLAWTINNDRDIQQSIHVLGWEVTVIHSKLNNTVLLTARDPLSKTRVASRSPLDFNRFHITLELELIHLQQNLPSYFNWLYVNIIFENCCYSRWDEPSNTCPFAAAVGISSVLLYDLFLCWAKTLEDVSKNTKHKLISSHISKKIVSQSQFMYLSQFKKPWIQAIRFFSKDFTRHFKIITWHSERLIAKTQSNDNKSHSKVSNNESIGLGNFQVTNPANPNSHNVIRVPVVPPRNVSH